ELQLGEAVQGPIRAEGERAIAAWQDRFRTGTAVRPFGAIDAVEPQALEPGAQLDGAGAAHQELVVGFHRPLLLLAGDDPGAGDVPRSAARIGKTLVAEALPLATVAHQRVLGAGADGTERPVDVRLPALADAFDVDRIVERVLRHDRPAAKSVRPE